MPSPETVPLSPAIYWRLRSHLQGVELARLQLQQAQAKVKDVLGDLAATHGIATDAEWQLDDETCSMRLLPHTQPVEE